MNLVIVDNGSHHIRELVELCSTEIVRSIPRADLGSAKFAPHEIIILSGGHSRPVVGNEEYFRHELNLLASATNPVLGICLGFELIAHHAGAELIKAAERISGTVEVFPTPEGSNWFGESYLRLAEGHFWVVKDAPAGFMTLATSSDGIEAIANLDHRIVGFQFHPEHLTSSPAGSRVFKRALRRLASIDQ